METEGGTYGVNLVGTPFASSAASSAARCVAVLLKKNEQKGWGGLVRMREEIGELDAPFAPLLPLLRRLLPPFTLVLLSLGLDGVIAGVGWRGFVLLALLALARVLVCVGLKLFAAFLAFR